MNKFDGSINVKNYKLDLFKYTGIFRYYGGDQNNDGYTYGMLLVLSDDVYTAQILIEHLGDDYIKLKVRGCTSSGNWSRWIQV